MIWWLVMALTAVVAALAGWLEWQRRRHLVVTVQGQSMSPTYQHGDRVLVRRRRPDDDLLTGEVVVVDLPARLRPVPKGTSAEDTLRNRRVIKRVAAVAGEPVPFPIDGSGPVVPAGCLVLLGDNPDSSGDSRMFGCVGTEDVVGVVRRALRS